MYLAELTWPDVDRMTRDTPIVLPIAAHEQHGHHLPLHTDSMLLGEIVSRVEAKLKDQILVSPLQWLGNSHHHMDFPGTISADPPFYLDLLINQIECFLAHGFRRIILINGHGGNIVPSSQVVFTLRQKHRDRSDLLLLASTYWENGHLDGDSLELDQRTMGHACEWETSMMLALRPELVKDYRQLEPIPEGEAFPTASRGWTMKDRTKIGHIGSPASASPEKGHHLFNAFSQGVVSFLEEVIQWDGRSWDQRRA